MQQMVLKHINPPELPPLQKENYNFHKVTGLLADYGFNCIRLTDDWKGADFLAVHIDGKTLLKVQQKGSAVIVKKLQGKGIHMAFPIKGQWYLVPHSKLFNIVRKEKGLSWIKEKEEWKKKGKLWLKGPRWLQDKLTRYVLKPSSLCNPHC